MSSHELAKLNLRDVESAGYTTAVLPTGATEPHNYHLPYGTDNIIAEHIARKATRHANKLGGKCVCLPPLQFGYDGNMQGFPLVINLQPTTIMTIVKDIGLSLAESGIQYLFILNGHGGNELKSIIRELKRDVNLFISGANWWEAIPDVLARVCPDGGDHANDFETAAILHIAPELVKMKLAADGAMTDPLFPEFKQNWVKFSRPWKAFAPSSGAGDPRRATAKAGEIILNAAVERIGGFLHKLSTAKRTPGFPYDHKKKPRR
ncbi:creatininase family protein [Candidatus Sumerlaeota bacterium]|nr:creatininase family protein [Candidatus Sumerlaeota bacterium]